MSFAEHPRSPGQTSIEFPEGRRLRSSKAYRAGGTSALAFFVVGILLGATALGAGYWLKGGVAATPPTNTTPTVSVHLRATLSGGFQGVGGAIDGVRNPKLNVSLGAVVAITVTAGETMGHDFTIDEFGVKTKLLVNAGDSDTVTFTANKEGTFYYYCSVPGHRQAGMEGQLVVGTPSATMPGPMKPVDVADITHNATALPPPLARNYSATVNLYLQAEEVTAYIESNTTTFTYWTFNGTVPGPFFRVRVNDTVIVHFRNPSTNTMEHSVDFHAVTGPGGGMAATMSRPGEEHSFSFRPLNPGIFVYHCASPHIPTHISSGMYGMILVEPEGGLPRVDREFYVMQGDIYTKWPAGTAGHQEFDGTRLEEENPTYVVFNGKFDALTGADALRANVNETVRIFFGVGGPNLISSFHIIGEILDRVYVLGDLVDPPLQSIQTVMVPPGGATVVELTLQVAGTFLLVDHSLTRTIDKGCLGQLKVTGPGDPGIYNPNP